MAWQRLRRTLESEASAVIARTREDERGRANAAGASCEGCTRGALGMVGD
jgi:hypothetical protein